MIKFNRLTRNIIASVLLGLLINFSLVIFITDCSSGSTFEFGSFISFVVFSGLFGLAILGFWLDKRDFISLGSLAGITSFGVLALIRSGDQFSMFRYLPSSSNTAWTYVVSTIFFFSTALAILFLFALCILKAYFKVSLFKNAINFITLAALGCFATYFLFAVIASANNYLSAANIYHCIQLGLLIPVIDLSFITLFPDIQEK